MRFSGRTQRNDPEPQRMDLGQGKAAQDRLHHLGDDLRRRAALLAEAGEQHPVALESGRRG